MSSQNATLSAATARQLLNLALDADAAGLAQAYRTAVKAAHPDRPGGDAERLRQVIEAHRLLKTIAESPLSFAPAPRRRQASVRRTPLLLTISVPEALFGGERRVLVDEGRQVDVQLPAGLRSSDVLRLAGVGPGGLDVLLRIAIASADGLSIRGHDLWVELPVERRQLRRGARLQLLTPRGERTVLAPKGVDKGAVVRLRGEGLPARDKRPAGDMIVRLRIADGAAEVASRDLLRRFSARWAA